MTATLLRVIDRVASVAGLTAIAVALLAAAPSLTAMVAASHLIGA